MSNMKRGTVCLCSHWGRTFMVPQSRSEANRTVCLVAAVVVIVIIAIGFFPLVYSLELCTIL